MVILGTYNGKPPSLGKRGFPFFWPAATPLPWEIYARRMRHWHWGSVRCRDSLRLPQGRVAAALCSFATRCNCPAMLDVLALELCDVGTFSANGWICWQWDPMRC